MVFHSSLVASGLMPPQLSTEHVLPWRLRSYWGVEGRRSDIVWTEGMIEGATEADEDTTEELLAVTVVAAVVMLLMWMIELSWSISRSSLIEDH